MKHVQVFLAVLAPQFLILAGMVGYSEWILATGTEVVLEVHGYDPMDLFRGRYVQYRPVIRELDDEVPHPEPWPQRGARLYVRLEEGEPFWRATEVAREPREDGVWIRAEVESVEEEHALLDYRLRRFYISDDAEDPTTVRDPDGEPPSLGLVVVIGPDRRGMTRDLLVDGTPYAEWNAARQER